MTRPVERDDLFRVRWVGAPAVSPDGKRVAFVVAGLDPVADRMLHEVHLVGVGQAGTPARRIGPVEATERAPAWSPDGHRLALLSDRDGDPAIWIVDPERGAAHRAARAPGPITDFAWSPDGTRFAATVARAADAAPTDLPFVVDGTRTLADGRGPVAGPDRREVWILAADGDGSMSLTPAGQGSDWAPTWSPDGRSIACCSDRGLDPARTAVTGLWVVAADGTARWPVVDAAGPIKVARWSPDGRAIAVLGHRRGDAQGENTELWLVEVDRGGLEDPAAAATPAPGRQLGADLDRSIGQAVRGEDERGFGLPDLAWTPDGERILAIAADGGTSSLCWFDREGRSGTVVAATSDDGAATADGVDDRCVLQFAVAARTGELVLAISDPATPGELWWTAPDGSGERRLTAVNDAWLADLDLAPTRRIRAASRGGPEIDGWLTGRDLASPVAEPRPLVLQVHGGPHYPIGARFSIEAQALAAQGFLVLGANPRGSQGYGAAFATAIRGRWGGPDLDDVLALVDRVVEMGLADGTRVAIMGESYGGYLAAWAIGQTDRFAAAIAENPITDLRTIASQGGGATFWASEMGGSPWEQPERYVARSPLTHVERMSTPLLLLHAELDGNCPIAQSEVLHAALRALGRDVTFVRIPGEGHLVNLFGRPSRRRARQSIVDAFLQAMMR